MLAALSRDVGYTCSLLAQNSAKRAANPIVLGYSPAGCGSECYAAANA